MSRVLDLIRALSGNVSTNDATATNTPALDDNTKKVATTEFLRQQFTGAGKQTLADRKGDVSTTILAKEIGISAFRLNSFLREMGVKWQKADLPIAGYQEWFNVIADVKNGHEFTQCLITPHGQIEIAKLWNKNKK